MEAGRWRSFSRYMPAPTAPEATMTISRPVLRSWAISAARASRLRGSMPFTGSQLRLVPIFTTIRPTPAISFFRSVMLIGFPVALGRVNEFFVADDHGVARLGSRLAQGLGHAYLLENILEFTHGFDIA